MISGLAEPAPKNDRKSSETQILGILPEVMAIAVEDGVEFDLDALSVERIREELEHGGLRLRTRAAVAGARVSVMVDIGFGDAVEPGLETIEYPVLLDLPAPRLRAYAKETVVAEKFQAMVALGRANSRMKDFHDVWLLSKAFAFETDRLARALAATFARRRTPYRLCHPTHSRRISRPIPRSSINGPLSLPISMMRHETCTPSSAILRSF